MIYIDIYGKQKKKRKAKVLTVDAVGFSLPNIWWKTKKNPFLIIW